MSVCTNEGAARAEAMADVVELASKALVHWTLKATTTLL